MQKALKHQFHAAFFLSEKTDVSMASLMTVQFVECSLAVTIVLLDKDISAERVQPGGNSQFR